MSKRAAIYLRVSTNEQTTANQRRELEKVAESAGWDVVSVFEDAGISGAAGRDKRPALEQMLKAVTRREIDLVAAWSVDRLGRSLQDLIGQLNELRAVGCDLYLHQQALDTTTPAGRAMFGMLGVFAEFEREMIRERVKSGLARAKAKGKRLGRPTVAHAVEREIRRLSDGGMGMLKIGRTLGVGTGTVQRVLHEAKSRAAADA